MTLKGQGFDPDMFGAHYLENGWKYILDYNGTPIGNSLLRIEWLRDRYGHVTLKGQGRDQNTLRGQYLENGWR